MSERVSQGHRRAASVGEPDDVLAVKTTKTEKLAETATQACEALAELRRAGDAVADIADAFGLSISRLAGTEGLDRLELDTTVDLDALDRLSESRLAGWFEALAPDLRLDLRLSTLAAENATQTVTLRAAAGTGSLIHALREGAASRGDEAALDARISIGKTRARDTARALVDGREAGGAAQPTVNIHVFYCSAVLMRLLDIHAAADWKRLGLVLSKGRVVLLLCDAAGYLAGPALEVVGARSESEPRWLEVSRSALRRFEERAEQEQTLRAEESQWPGAPAVLTPDHLRVERREPGLEPVAAGLAHMRAELAAGYLASTVQDGTGTDGKLLLRFAGPRPCACRLSSYPDPSAPFDAESDSLARLAAWAYQHASPDKLAIARECLAAELPPGGGVSLADVERAAGRALEAAKANFVLYLRHNSAAYFQRRQQALDAVSAYAETVRKSVGDLTGEVVDAVYRTAGLLVAVVIAGLIQPSASLDVQRLACVLLIAYVLFVLLFLMRSRHQRYELETDDLDSRLEAMTELTTAERARLRERAAAANYLFVRYFRISQAVYMCLAAAGVLYFVLLLTPLAPHIALPHPNPTSTATPP